MGNIKGLYVAIVPQKLEGTSMHTAFLYITMHVAAMYDQ